MKIIDKIKPYLKALVAFVTPGVVGLVAAVQDGSPGDSTVTGAEWVGIAAACLLTGGAVFGAPNKDPKGTHQEESVQPTDSPEDEADDPGLWDDDLAQATESFHGGSGESDPITSDPAFRHL